MSDKEENLRAAYGGDPARHSEYGVGDHITYRDAENRDITHTGEIVLTLAAAGELPLRYVVERDDHGGFPDTVYPQDIIE